MAATIEFHEAANIFPLDDENLDSLAEDIRKNKQITPIETLEGKIIDGRRRWHACRLANVTPIYKAVKVADPIAYVLSLNLHRRHLAPSQLAMVGARAREMYDTAAKERMSEGGKSAGKGRPKEQGMENLPHPTGSARDAVGKAIGVSGKTIDHATRVLKEGTPELVKAVEEGRMAVSTAAFLANEPPEVQHEEINQPKRNRKYIVGKGNVGVAGPKEEPDEEPENNSTDRKGKGVILANEAINCLIRIPKNDALRKRGLQIVTDWIRKNK